MFTWRGVVAPLGESTYLEWEVAPLHWTRSTDERENFAHAGLNLRWRTGGFGLSSFGVGVGAYADWEDQPDSDRTGFLVGASAGLLADKLRVGLGFLRGETRRDGNGFLFTIGVTDLKGLAYWL